MDKKYYDLIISLIKKHRKYPGLEAILDDIANDVYEHSKVVIGTVTNEEIIESYFNKVISTSIITVPKKMNFNTRTRHRIISTIEPETTSVNVENIIETNENSNAEEFFENTDATEELISTEQETNFLQEEVDTLEQTETIDNIVIEEELSTDDDNLEDFDTETVLVEEEEEEEIIIPAEQEVNVDKSLVDKMINDSTKATVEEIKENNTNFEALDVLFVKDNETLEEEAESEVEIAESIEELQTVNEEIEELGEELVEEIDHEEIVDEVLVEETLDKDFTEDDITLETEDTTEALVDLEIEESEDVVLELEEEEEEEEENTSPTIEVDKNSDEYQAFDYSCFNYTPNNIEFDSEDILLSLKEVQKDFSNTNILDICELKFIQNKTVAEIAEQTGVTRSTVIEILNDVSEAIKE